MITASLIALHVLAAAFWTGSVLLLVAFIGPTVPKAGAEGAVFMRTLMQGARLPTFFGVVAATTILSGFVILWILSGGFQQAFMRSETGALVSAGAAFGIVAVVTGVISGRLGPRGVVWARATASLLVVALVLMALGAHI